jgi:hypothetical protein
MSNNLENTYLRLQKMLKYDENKKVFILDIENEELKEHFQFQSFPKALTMLKIWVTELNEKNIENELDEDSLIEFFKIKYFMNVNSKDLRSDSKFVVKGSVD